jgi:hypothetical protein
VGEWVSEPEQHDHNTLNLNFEDYKKDSSHYNNNTCSKIKINTYLCLKNQIMNTKLTLTIEKEVIETAKEYAKEKGQSLSEMVENYFKLITVKRKKIKPKHLSSNVQKLRGILKSNDVNNYKQTLTEELSKKYGL